jgi:hypothetical protein
MRSCALQLSGGIECQGSEIFDSLVDGFLPCTSATFELTNEGLIKAISRGNNLAHPNITFVCHSSLSVWDLVFEPTITKNG